MCLSLIHIWTFYNEVLTDHNRYPGHKEKLADANLVLEGVNPSCGDDIVLQLRVEDGRIAEGTFTGDGCAISQASVAVSYTHLDVYKRQCFC